MKQTLHKICRRATLATTLALLGGAALAPLAAGPAWAQAAITSCPRTLIQPGTYTLAADLVCPGDAITIAADNVRLLLNGRSLTGDGTGNGVLADGTAGSNPTLERLSIQGPGTVRGFRDGVHVEDAPAARVLGLTAAGNADDGVEVDLSPGARVSDSVLTGNRFGLYVRNCEGCQATGNQVDDTGVDGILTGDTPRARITGNTVTGSGDDGLDLNGCNGCEVSSNRATGSGDAGIEVFNFVTGARIVGNTAAGNGGQGIELSRETVDGNLVQGNVATGNGTNPTIPNRAGIRVNVGATGNRLVGNRATGNAPVDLIDFNPVASPCANAWVNNAFATDSEGDGPAGGCIR